jgi:hypothetical protein
MIERAPPKLALWLLKKWGSAYQSESLAGDLIEQYQEGRGRAWYWKQVTAAILIAQGRFIRNMPWATVGRVVSRLIAETAAVLAFAVVVDQARRTHSLAQMMMNHPFNRTVIELIAVALIGFLVSIRPDKRRPARAAINAVMLAFGVIALGAGTLTWADTLRSDTCRSAACGCISQ